jgi:hypothetical protein
MKISFKTHVGIDMQPILVFKFNFFQHRKVTYGNIH